MTKDSENTAEPIGVLKALSPLIVMAAIAVTVAALMGTPWTKILGVTLISAVLFGLGIFNALSESFRKGQYVERVLAAYFKFCGWMLLAFAPSTGLLWLNQFVLERLALLPQVVIFVIWGLLLAIAVGLVATDSKRHRLFSSMQKRVGSYSPLVYSFNLLIIAMIFFSSVTYVLVTHGKLTFGGTLGSSVTFGKLQDFYLWHFMDALPLLKITDTLKWTNPLSYDNGLVGMVLLLFKLTVIVPVIASFAYYWKNYGKADPPADNTIPSLF